MLRKWNFNTKSLNCPNIWWSLSKTKTPSNKCLGLFFPPKSFPFKCHNLLELINLQEIFFFFVDSWTECYRFFPLWPSVTLKWSDQSYELKHSIKQVIRISNNLPLWIIPLLNSLAKNVFIASSKNLAPKSRSGNIYIWLWAVVNTHSLIYPNYINRFIIKHIVVLRFFNVCINFTPYNVSLQAPQP